MAEKTVLDWRSPYWSAWADDWERWRLTSQGGPAFRDRYLARFSDRENDTDFQSRKDITPIPAFAKEVLQEIRNAIFQRLRDVVRSGGSQKYQDSVAGLSGGVDGYGNTMNAFIGVKVLDELLAMGRVGVFVDAPPVEPTASMADVVGVKPYLYRYQIEDILSYAYLTPNKPAEFKALLLRDTSLTYDPSTFLPTRIATRYRRFWVDGGVFCQVYDQDSKEIGGPLLLEMQRIPFVLLDLGDSLLKDVSYHQIALLNLCSSDVSYALKSNFPFYVRQEDPRAMGSHLKTGTNAGTAMSGGQASADNAIRVGVTQGQTYPMGANEPSFINPSAEPLRASMELQANLKNGIRELVNLAVTTLATRASAESKTMDNQGLEAGLSYIGQVLENAERQIAEFWATYESKNPKTRNITSIRYPERYNLKTDSERIKEADDLYKLMNTVPGRTAKREIAKSMVLALLGGRVSASTLATMNTEIDEAPYTTSDPDTILNAVEKGLCGEETGSLALGFDPAEHEKARADHLERIARIAELQGVKAGKDPGARGVKDLSANPDARSEEVKDIEDTEDKEGQNNG